MRNFYSFILIFIFASILNAQMMGGHWGDQSWDHNDRHNMDWPDSSAIVELTGTVIIDSSLFMPHYFLDIDYDSQPDYLIGFGPYWYQPEEAPPRPLQGDNITIKGWLQHGELNMVVVMELNGQSWRNPSAIPPWSGNWIHKDSTQNQYVYCPTDSASWLEFRSGSMMGGGHGGDMMFSDSIYCQFELVHPDSLPGFPDSTCFVGFHINIFDDNRNDMMGGGRFGMGFRANIGHRFHFTDEMLEEMGIMGNRYIELRSFDSETGWTTNSSSVYIQDENIVELNTSDVQSYYGLFATSISTGINEKTTHPEEFVLYQNYPNPFNPTTEIKVDLKNEAHIKLSVYNVLGKNVRTLANDKMPAGSHTFTWDGMDANGNQLASGLYSYVFESQSERVVRKMMLLK